jgi:hypothetical protein
MKLEVAACPEVVAKVSKSVNAQTKINEVKGTAVKLRFPESVPSVHRFRNRKRF